MPFPLVPIAAATIAAIAVARAARPVRIDQRGEEALDAMAEGIGVSRVPGREQTSATARLRRVIRLRPGGPGLEFDAGLLGRLRVRRV